MFKYKNENENLTYRISQERKRIKVCNDIPLQI